MSTIDLIREKAVRLNGAGDINDEILALIGDARFVLIGEASHGTHEFYECRAEITKRLIAEKGFSAVAVEADFPDAYRVNRFVRGIGSDRNADEALRDFGRFPLWMWRNTEVLEFVEWLKAFNAEKPPNAQAGFYGIDLYSLHASMEAVLKYLEKVDPEAARRARSRYSCFDHHGEDAQSYGYAASFDMSQSCEDEAVNQLVELQRRAAEYANRDGFVARDEYFFAEQNARLVKNAEEYYRQMFRGRVSSWNLRDRHMAETVASLASHLENQGQSAKIVVWAHNSHLGDARATDMSRGRGEWNVGQLVREQYGEQDVRLIGFTTFEGTVTAATNWDEPAQLKRVRQGLNNSYERLLHQVDIPNFFLNLRDEETREILRRPMLERAIGVIYRPETERVSHYFEANLAEQFDGVIHFDRTRALEPLDKVPSWRHDDAPETFPEGL
ncbi:MAG TPA: erythromycin esterase family protein [Pyrinomonadaceae bacterium]|nr:erythromycin esterase family protein [Pyrinomonadaceae bacterium]